MSDIRDGFLYHPDGETPHAQMARLLSGEHNPAFDDLFSTTVKELNDEIKAAEKDRKRLLEQLANLRQKLLSLRSREAEVSQAVERFHETGEIADVLIPACSSVVADERLALANGDAANKSEEIELATADVVDKLCEDWSVTKTEADDEYVYITVRRQRSVSAPVRPSAEDLMGRKVKKVKAAFEAYRNDFIGCTRLFPITTVPTNPRASP